MGFKPASAPPPAVKRDITKFQAFAGELLVVVPHSVNEINRNYPTRDDGSPNTQTYATVFPVEAGSHKDDNGNKTVWKAGDKHYVYFTGAILRYFKEDGVDDPIVGRLVKGPPGKKGGRPWQLAIPTDEEVEQANSVEGLDATVQEAIQEAQERRDFFASREAQVAAANEARSDEDEEEDDEVATAPWKKSLDLPR